MATYTVFSGEGGRVTVRCDEPGKYVAHRDGDGYGVVMPSGRLGFGVRRGEATEFADGGRAISMTQEWLAREVA